jgi:hypothetical protein
MIYLKPALTVTHALAAVRAMGKGHDDLDNGIPAPQFDTSTAYEADE